ncbi:MAG: U32 family peptidase [Planctomycetia bacterium]|nr:U32 family peptidase [Planctomycetia bacterium]
MLKIMAPAGSPESLNAAIKAGADEVYMGISGFGARRFATNFSVEEYCQAIDFAHRNDVRVHLTLNTIMSDAELNQIKSQIVELWQTGLDAVIVQDMGVVLWLKEHFPDLPLHASTQMSLANVNELQWIEKQGFKRAVLARELSLNEIEKIRQKTSIELEVFASGALCLCCSGKCYLSSFIGGRSGNRGMCTQPCRQYYSILNVDSHSYSNVNSDFSQSPKTDLRNANHLSLNNEGYFLSTKDQWQQYSEIKQLLKIGVDSIKIEGRMKSPVYVYEAVHYYRSLIDQFLGVDSEEQKKRLFFKADSWLENENESLPNTNHSSIKKSNPKTIFNQKNHSESVNKTLENEDCKSKSMDHSSSVSNEYPDQLEIVKIFNRGYAKGYFYEHDPDLINSNFSSDNGFKIGTIKNGFISLSDSIRNGDGVVYLDSWEHKIEGQNVNKINLVIPVAKSDNLQKKGNSPRQNEENNVYQNVNDFKKNKSNPKQNSKNSLSNHLNHSCQNDFQRNRDNNPLFADRSTHSQKQYYQNAQRRETIQVDAAFPGQQIILENLPPQNACFLNKTFDIAVNKRNELRIKQTTRHLPINVRLNAHCGKPLELVLCHDRAEICIVSDKPLEKSQKIKTNLQQLQNDLNRFGNSPFYMKNSEISADSDVFIPRSLLNQLRQKATKDLEQKIVLSYRRFRSQNNQIPQDNQSTQLSQSRQPNHLTDINDFEKNNPLNLLASSQKNHSPRIQLNQSSQLKSMENSEFSVCKNNNDDRISENETNCPTRLRNKDRLSSFSAAVRTAEQFAACQKMGISRIYYLTQPVVFQDSSDERKMFLLEQIKGHHLLKTSVLNESTVPQSTSLFDDSHQTSASLSNNNSFQHSDFKGQLLAGSLFDAIFFNDQGIDFAADWTFNMGNRRAIQFYGERFPYLKTVFLSPELSERACSEIVQKRDSCFPNRPVRLGLNIYGHLAAMFTRKTLFPQKITDLINQDGRNIAVVKNNQWFKNQNSKMTGSSVYYSEPLDLIDAIPWIETLNLDELRFDFSIESESEIVSIINRAIRSKKGDSYSTHSYGFTKGIF